MAGEPGETRIDDEVDEGFEDLELTILLSVAFYIVLYAVLRITGAPDLTAEHVLVALMPFLILLINSDRIAEIRAGSLLVRLREEARSAIDPEDDETVETMWSLDEMGVTEDDLVDVEPEDVMAKGGVENVEYRVAEERPSTLSFVLGRHYYGPAIERYLEANLRHNPAFEYALFLEDDGRFAGLMCVPEFSALVRAGSAELVDAIASRDVLEVPGMNRGRIGEGATKRAALARMEALDAGLLAVVDERDRFVSAITQDDLSRELLLGLFGEDGA